MIYMGRHPNSYDNPYSDTIGYKVKIYRPRNVQIEIIEDNK